MSEINVITIGQTETSTASQVWVDGRHVCFFIEDGPNRDKIPGKTRIRGGRMPLNRVYQSRFAYPEYGYVWAIDNTVDFGLIRVHRGNFVEDTNGCPLACRAICFRDGNWFGYNSKKGYDDWMRALEHGDRHWIDFIRTD